MAPEDRDVSINMSGISVAGVGGLGLVAVAALMTYVFPQAWWLEVFGAAGGTAGRHRHRRVQAASRFVRSQRRRPADPLPRGNAGREPRTPEPQNPEP